MSVTRNYPEAGKKLLGNKGREIIKQIGKETIKETVLSVLSGENVRNSTEFNAKEIGDLQRSLADNVFKKLQ